jgi:hypothetical protein
VSERVFWLSWWDPPNGKPGLPVDGIDTWHTGYRGDDTSVCARVEADNEDEAWRKADRYYPGAAEAERRFSEERPRDWWPPRGRFPRAPAEGKEREG